MARRNGLWRACEPLRQGADICPQPRTDAAYGLARRQRERLATVWPEAWMGAEVVRPAAPWVPIRMAAINTGSGQHGKGEAVELIEPVPRIWMEASAPGAPELCPTTTPVPWSMLKNSPMLAPGWRSIPVSEWAISVMMRGNTGTCRLYNS